MPGEDVQAVFLWTLHADPVVTPPGYDSSTSSLGENQKAPVLLLFTSSAAFLSPFCCFACFGFQRLRFVVSSVLLLFVLCCHVTPSFTCTSREHTPLNIHFSPEDLSFVLLLDTNDQHVLIPGRRSVAFSQTRASLQSVCDAQS